MFIVHFTNVLFLSKKIITESFQQNLQIKSVGREETFLQTILNNHIEQFFVPNFAAVSGHLEGKLPVVDDVLSSKEQEIYLTTSLDGNCIDFEFPTDRIYYDDLRRT